MYSKLWEAQCVNAKGSLSVHYPGERQPLLRVTSILRARTPPSATETKSVAKKMADAGSSDRKLRQVSRSWVRLGAARWLDVSMGKGCPSDNCNRWPGSVVCGLLAF